MKKIEKKYNFITPSKKNISVMTLSIVTSLGIVLTGCSLFGKIGDPQENTSSSIDTINPIYASESIISGEETFTSEGNVPDVTSFSTQATEYIPDDLPVSDTVNLLSFDNLEFANLVYEYGNQHDGSLLSYYIMSWEPGMPIPYCARLYLSDLDNVTGIDWLTIPCVPEITLENRDNELNSFGPIFNGRQSSFSLRIDELNTLDTDSEFLEFINQEFFPGQTYTNHDGLTAQMDYRFYLHVLYEFSLTHPDHQLEPYVYEVFGTTEEEVANYVYERDDENPILDYSLIESENPYYVDMVNDSSRSRG